MHGDRQGSGFTIVEAAVVVVAVALVCCLAATTGQLTRKRAGLVGSLANLKKIGETGANYAADFDEALWAFSWRPFDSLSDYPDLQNPLSEAAAFMYQTVDIVRRLSGDEFIPRLDNRFGPPFTSTLVLADYLDDAIPAEWMVSPGDRLRLDWQADPDDLPGFGEQGGEVWESIFCPYGSSYGLMPAFWAPDERSSDGQNTVSQYVPRHDLFLIPNNVPLGRRSFHEVSFPSQKVQVAEREQFFFGVRPVYYLHPTARVPLLMADGSAGVRTTADANRSGSPNNLSDPLRATLLDYKPNSVYEAEAISGGARDEDLDGKYKWTRHGLRGIDFSGERSE